MLEFQVGSQFHGLELLRYCGGGAFGEVYYCQDVSGRRLAVKIISKSGLGGSWERELRGVRNYMHMTQEAPQLLQIFHVEEDEDYFFYTMEAADNAEKTCNEYTPDTLAWRLKDGALPEQEGVKILFGIFEGIKVIHQAGYAHRDIKPDNILFVNGVPKLGDIGLLSSLDITVTQLAGTMEFLPPEVRAQDSSYSTDRTSRQHNDLYAFGKVIYCVMTGQEPQAWPAIPAGMPLTLALKLFFRLACHLCNREPLQRLAQIEEVEQELQTIERQLQTGETLGDKTRYWLSQSWRCTKGGFLASCRLICCHWLLSLLFLGVFAGTVWWVLPEAPFDLAEVETKLYRHEELGVEMTVPAEWEWVDVSKLRGKQAVEEFVDEMLSDMQPDETKKLTPEQMAARKEFFTQIFMAGGSVIACNLDYVDFADNVCVVRVAGTWNNLMDDGIEVLRVRLQQAMRGEMGLAARVYEVKQLELHGRRCLFEDITMNEAVMRQHTYVFDLGDDLLSITLTAKKERFWELEPKFRQALSTVRFFEPKAKTTPVAAQQSSSSEANR